MPIFLTRKCNKKIMFSFFSTVSYGPGQYFDDLDTNSVANCPIGEYQDGLAQTTCKTCPEGYYPNSDQTECLRKLFSMSVEFFILTYMYIYMLFLRHLLSKVKYSSTSLEIRQKINFYVHT